jgi:hypothetical protein
MGHFKRPILAAEQLNACDVMHIKLCWRLLCHAAAPEPPDLARQNGRTLSDSGKRTAGTLQGNDRK